MGVKRAGEGLAIAVFITAWGILAVVGVVSYTSNSTLVGNAGEVVRSMDSLRTAGQLKSMVSDAVSSADNYCVTGDPADRMQFNILRPQILAASVDLGQRSLGGPAEKQRLNSTLSSITTLMPIIDAQFKSCSHRASETTHPPSLRSRPVVSAIERDLTQALRTESLQLQVNEERAQNQGLFTSLVIWIGTTIALVMVTLATISVRRESRQRLRARQRVAAQFAATRLLSESSNLAQATRRLLPELALTLEYDCAEVWMQMPEGGALACTDYWMSEQVDRKMAEALDGALIRPGESLVGGVFAAQEARWVEHLTQITEPTLLAACQAAGLRGGVAAPILIWPDVAGVLVLRSRRAAPYDRDLLQTASSIGGQLGQFINRRRALETLASASELQRAILQSANFSIIATDSSGVIQIFNATAEKWLQYKAEALIGASTPLLLHRSEELSTSAARLAEEYNIPAPEGFEALAARARRGAIDECDWTYLRRDGSSFPVQLSITALRDDNGSVTGFLMIGKDITERKEIDRIKNEFVSIVSHELRTPLTSVRGSLGLLAAGLLGDVSDKAKRMLQISINNTDRLVRLINDILDIERLESGKVSMERQPIEAEQLITQSSEVMRGMAQKFNIVIKSKNFRAKVFADPDRIVQTLTNLLSNAIKFSTPGAEVEVGGYASSKQATFYVRDTGRGIPEEKRQLIFERFQQVDASDSREKGGTGLGLAICRTIIEQHGGRIWVESKVGSGSVFYFTLPLHQEETTPGESAQASSAKVMICDDDSWLRGIVTNLLQQGGYQTVTASAGGEMLEKLPAEKPDVLLLDLMLPDISGWEALDQLRVIEGFANLPVIILSSSAERNAEAEHLRMVQGWVQKPFDTRGLYRAVQEVLAQPRRRVLYCGQSTPAVGELRALLDARGVNCLNVATAEELEHQSADLLAVETPEDDEARRTLFRHLQSTPAHARLPLLLLTNSPLDPDSVLQQLPGRQTQMLRMESSPQTVTDAILTLLQACEKPRES